MAFFLCGKQQQQQQQKGIRSIMCFALVRSPIYIRPRPLPVHNRNRFLMTRIDTDAATAATTAAYCHYEWNEQTPIHTIKQDAIDYLTTGTKTTPSSSSCMDTSEATVAVEQLLAHTLKLSWDNGYRLIRNNQQPYRYLTMDQLQTFQRYLHRRGKCHEPLQYILGQWDFLDITLQVRSPLLCPRPETEELVLMVAEEITNIRTATRTATHKQPSTTIRILDVGCGTGAIGIALLHSLPKDAAIHVTAIDVEPIAISTSTMNAKTILSEGSSKYQTIQCSAAEYQPDDGLFDLVVSNPPYIPTADMEGLDKTVRDFESHTALCGGIDGLNVIRDIIYQLPHWCVPGAFCFMEVNPSHTSMVKTWLEHDTTIGVDFVSGHQDMFGLDRFVKLQVRHLS